MKKNIKGAIQSRRSHYVLSNRIPVSDQELVDMIKFAAQHMPSALNGQSSRIVLLWGNHHKKLWEITKQTLKERLSAEAFINTEKKIDNSFLSGYGTVLFYEDKEVVEEYQKRFPLYSKNFPVWPQETAGMYQYVIWLMFEKAGIGASLQQL